jgi:hypothetical protein
MRRFYKHQVTLLLLLGLLPSALCADDIVIDDSGTPIKLVTTRSTSLHAEPDPGSASSPAKIFRYWYVLPPDPGMASRRHSDLGSLTRNDFYRVASGLSESDFKGWLAEDDVVIWNHRQALRPAAQKGRELVTFYASREEAVAAVRTGDTGAATHREPLSVNDLLLMPILEADEVRIDDEPNRVFKVAFVSAESNGSGGAATPRTAATGGLTKSIVRKQTTVDIVFVVDTTASMARPIEQVRASIARVARNLSRRTDLQQRLRLGLVGYRDTLDGVRPGPMEYLTKVICDLRSGADHGLFQRRLAEMKLAQGASEDYAEDVLAGIDTAMEDRLGWNPFAWKVIVVVGDSSAKTPDHPDLKSRKNAKGRTVQSIIDQAEGKKSSQAVSSYVISAVRIKDPLFLEDHVIGDRQFNRMVAGQSYNGRMISTQGGAVPGDFSKDLTDYLLEAVENFEEAILLSGGVRPPPSGNARSDAYPYPVLDLLRRLPDESTEPGERFAARYCTELDADGNRVLIPHLFARRGKLKAFTSYLDFLIGYLEDAGDPGSRDVTELISQLQSMSMALQMDETLTADMELDRILAGILDLPIKTRVFQLSFGELAAMSKPRFQQWVRSVDAVQEMLKGVIENQQIWFKLHPNAQDRDAHAFVALSDLP